MASGCRPRPTSVRQPTWACRSDGDEWSWFAHVARLLLIRRSSFWSSFCKWAGNVDIFDLKSPRWDLWHFSCGNSSANLVRDVVVTWVRLLATVFLMKWNFILFQLNLNRKRTIGAHVGSTGRFAVRQSGQERAEAGHRTGHCDCNAIWPSLSFFPCLLFIRPMRPVSCRTRTRRSLPLKKSRKLYKNTTLLIKFTWG